jgi:hypothetical protein
MTNAVFWDVAQSRRFRGTYRFHHHGEHNQRYSNNVSSWMIISALMKEEMRSCETSVRARATRRYIQEAIILQCMEGL